MADLLLNRFESELADTVAWCGPKVRALDAEQVRRRQATCWFAEQQWREAIEIRDRAGLRSVAGIEQYQRAVALLEDVRRLLGPMEGVLRSQELKPTFSFDPFGDDVLWAHNLATRRSFDSISHDETVRDAAQRLSWFVKAGDGKGGKRWSVFPVFPTPSAMTAEWM